MYGCGTFILDPLVLRPGVLYIPYLSFPFEIELKSTFLKSFSPKMEGNFKNAIILILAIVQVRLDFDVFIVRQPETTGSCDDDTITFTTPTGTGMALPTLCGTLSDQHSKALNNYSNAFTIFI